MRLAEFMSSLRYEAVPTMVIEVMKRSLLDAIGCGLYGSRTPWAEIVCRYVEEVGGTPEATLWGFQCKRPAPNVALALGTVIHSFDYDDYHHAKIHPAAAVVPAAWCLGEAIGCSGKQLLTALVAGYEAMIRISLATGPTSSRMRGWHLTGTCGTFGAAASAARLCGLGAAATASALGLAGTQAAGLWAFTADGSQSKRFHPGRAAQSGIIAVELARRGYPGPTQILEAEDGGFCRATSDTFDLDEVTRDLGSIYRAEEVTIKPYACCGSLHSAVDGIFELRRHLERPDGIAKVILHTSGVVKTQCGFSFTPLSVLQAQMSAQYCLAAAIVDGQLLLQQFTEARIHDRRLLELAQRVEVVVDPEIDAVYPDLFASKVEVILQDGARHSCRIDHPRGSPARPIAQEALEAKFRELTEGIVDNGAAEAIVDRVGRLEELDDIAEISNLLRGRRLPQ